MYQAGTFRASALAVSTTAAGGAFCQTNGSLRTRVRNMALSCSSCSRRRPAGRLDFSHGERLPAIELRAQELPCRSRSFDARGDGARAGLACWRVRRRGGNGNFGLTR